MAMNNRVLSIEIGNSFTKICEMDYKVKKPKVYKVLTVETPEGIVVDGMLQPTQEYADHLVNALGTNGIRTKKVLFTISSTRVASREVQIPNVKASKIEALVKTNASDYFPVDLTQYEIGHYLAGGLAENGKLRVMGSGRTQGSFKQLLSAGADVRLGGGVLRLQQQQLIPDSPR